MKTTPAPRRIAAFTLVELLAVIGILGVLAAILIPLIGAARKSAHTVQASGNLRQWGVILNLYANDNRSLMPVPYYSDTHPSWKMALAPYADSTTRWRLMQDLNVPDRPAALYDPYRYRDGVTDYPSCYAMNETTNTLRVFGLRWDPRQVARPANYIVLGDARFNTAWSSSPSSFNGAHQLEYRQRGNTANVLFLDGHVQTLTQDAIPSTWLTPGAPARN